MTPAQIKAKEIFDMYYDGFNFDETYSGSRKQAKQCALIANQEVIQELESLSYLNHGTTEVDYGQVFRQEVKNEINNL